MKNFLLLYKKSSHTIYGVERKSSFYLKKIKSVENHLCQFKDSHQEHNKTLAVVESVFQEFNIKYDKAFRGSNIDYQKYDFVITVGGDGTFLEAARRVDKQILLGVNSAPVYSVGELCAANRHNFLEIFENVLCKKIKCDLLYRLQLEIDGEIKSKHVLNDVLVCHKNPAAMSRYCIQIGRIKEEQRSSGIWISTASGSSGAIHSAGGQVMLKTDKRMQYKARELYYGGNNQYRFQEGILNSRQKILITSLMREGKVFIDGTHLSLPFSFGSVLKVSISPSSLRSIISRKK